MPASVRSRRRPSAISQTSHKVRVPPFLSDHRTCPRYVCGSVTTNRRQRKLAHAIHVRAPWSRQARRRTESQRTGVGSCVTYGSRISPDSDWHRDGIGLEPPERSTAGGHWKTKIQYTEKKQ